MDLTGAGVEEKLDTGHAYRVQLWTNRLLGVVTAILGLVVVAQAGALISLFPLKEVQPMLLIGGSKDDQVWRVEPFEVGARGWDLIAEKLVKDYVLKRESIDLQTEVARWQEVAWMSSDETWRQFYKLMGRENPDSPFERAKREQLTRAISVDVVNMLNPAQFQVEFKQADFRNGEPVRERHLVATVTVEFREESVRYEDRYLNPTGLTVVAYGLAERAK